MSYIDFLPTETIAEAAKLLKVKPTAVKTSAVEPNFLESMTLNVLTPIGKMMNLKGKKEELIQKIRERLASPANYKDFLAAMPVRERTEMLKKYGVPKNYLAYFNIFHLDFDMFTVPELERILTINTIQYDKKCKKIDLVKLCASLI